MLCTTGNNNAALRQRYRGSFANIQGTVTKFFMQKELTLDGCLLNITNRARILELVSYIHSVS